MSSSTTEPAPIATPDNLVRAPLVIVVLDSGAGTIMAAVTDALRAAGNSGAVINAWRVEAVSGDYGHLLRAAMMYTFDPAEDES